MFKFIFTFGGGIYTGIYLAQNHEVPKVDDPGKLVERLKEFVDVQLNKTGEKKKDD